MRSCSRALPTADCLVGATSDLWQYEILRGHIAMRSRWLFVLPLLMACGRHAQLPPTPSAIPGTGDSADAVIAHALAPVLYVQRDEPFRLVRVVAVRAGRSM